MVVSLERKERNKEKFKANAMLRRFALPSPPQLLQRTFFAACCVIRWLLQRFVLGWCTCAVWSSLPL